MHSQERLVAPPRPLLALICVTLFLVLLPLTLSSPGLPVVLKADAAAFYLASLSLWQDGDLVCEDRDVRRLFREYPGTENLLLMGKGGGEPVYFGVPIVYPLLATPFVAWLGGKGMILLNAALLMVMVWMGFEYLRRYNHESLAAFFAASFFLLSTAFVYVFWLQAEVFNMACVMAAFYLIECGVGGRGPSAGTSAECPCSRRRLVLVASGAGAMLATASYGKPMLAVLALPLLARLFLEPRRRWQGLVTFVAAGLVTAAMWTGAAQLLTQEPWPYFAPRIGIRLSSPVDYLERKVAPRLERRVAEGADVEAPFSPSHQLLRAGAQLRVTMGSILLDAVPEFLFGRHGGFFVYMPFAVLCLLFFFLHERRSLFRWSILVSAVVVAVLFMTLVRGNWLGGGGFVGNRFFTAVYPSFLFLVRRIHPPALILLGFAAAGIFLGPLLLLPRGAPTLETHLLNQPFPRLPMEWSLERTLPSYQRFTQAGIGFHGRRDEIVARRDEVWVYGAKRVEMHLLAAEPTRSFVFDVRNLAPGNEIEMCLEGTCRHLTFGDDVPAVGRSERVVFEAVRGIRIPRQDSPTEGYRYRLTVSTKWGERPLWRGSGRENFYLGAALAFLGSPDDLARDLFAVEWLRVDAPESMAAGGTAWVPVTLRNVSRHPWPSQGGTRIRIAYHWLDENGDLVVREGKRSELPHTVLPGGEVEVAVRVDAPVAAGRWVLALDLIRERVSWFSEAEEGQVFRVPVHVLGAAGPGAAGPGAAGPGAAGPGAAGPGGSAAEVGADGG